MLRATLLNLPDKCGVYLMRDKDNRVIYVGKARSLKKRVASYFRRHYNFNLRRKTLIERAGKIDYVLTPTEQEALILENKLIKKNQPYFNIQFKDDKTYPYLEITNESYPQIWITRKLRHKKAQYFGPFTNVKNLKRILKILKFFLKIRTCKIKLPSRKKLRPCLNYQMHKCSAPCAGLIDKKTYNKNIKKAVIILKGEYDIILKILKSEINCFKRTLEFEKCKEIMSLINAIEDLRPRENIQHGKYLLLDKDISKQAKRNLLYNLGEKLNMEKLPIKLAAVDISNISGKHAFGSYVFFKRGIPDKKKYRLFKIKSVKEINDYDMLKEVLIRLKKQFKIKNLIPDFLLIDGGKGHLNVAKGIIKNTDIKLGALAKREELLYLEDSGHPLMINPSDKEFKVILNLRDEAHRFAVKSHRKSMRKAIYAK